MTAQIRGIRIAIMINNVMMTVLFAVALYTFFVNKLCLHFAMRGHWLEIGF